MRFGRRNSLLAYAGRVAVGACTAALAFCLATPVAHAETSKEVREKAAQENERLNELVTQLEEGRKDLDDLDRQMDDLTQKSVKVQGELIEDRAELRSMVSTSYRWGGSPSIWQIALSSSTIDEFISRVYYTNKVTQWQTGCVEQLKEDKHVLDEHMEQIDAVRTDRRETLAELQTTCDEVQASVDELLEYADGLDAKERVAEEERLTQISQQVEVEEQRIREQSVPVQGEAEARALAQKALTDAESLEARAAEDDARAAEAKAAAQNPDAQVTAANANGSDEKPAAVQDVAQADAAKEAAKEETPAAKEEAPAAKEETPAAKEETPAAKEETPAAKEEVPATSQPAAEEPKAEEPKAEEPKAAEPAEQQAQPAAEEAPAEAAPTENQEQPSAAEAASDSQSDSGGDWVECIASAYTAYDNSPAGEFETASGIPLDDSVPTVALPIAMDPERYYGSQVQIEYDGMSVVATVTDCGGMGGGSRGLDLTPAVFQAFGAETGDDWGLRDVRYRFL